jgi:uncharacterized protein YlxW (UPF0749 family)
MEFQSLKQLEKKLEYTVGLIDRLKNQTQAKDISYSKKDQELSAFRQKEEQLKAEVSRLENALKMSQEEQRKRQKELKKRLEGLVTKISVLERSA